jgi:DNA-directed RNA polymerase specialized sigma24 family protein
VLGIAEGTVASRLHYALRGLRAALDADARAVTREVAQ